MSKAAKWNTTAGNKAELIILQVHYNLIFDYVITYLFKRILAWFSVSDGLHSRNILNNVQPHSPCSVCVRMPYLLQSFLKLELLISSQALLCFVLCLCEESVKLGKVWEGENYRDPHAKQGSGGDTSSNCLQPRKCIQVMTVGHPLAPFLWKSHTQILLWSACIPMHVVREINRKN